MITIFTDGGCDINRRGANNIGGYAYAIINESGIKMRESVKKVNNTTNNEMELLGVISALQSLSDKNEEILIRCDSNYVVNAINLNWINKWVTKNFTRKNGTEDIPNAKHWRVLWELLQKFPNVHFKWIKAHQNNNSWNDYVDKLVQSVYQKNFTVIN